MTATTTTDALPRDADAPVFAEPWQAQAFALAVQLHRSGCFEWTEWAEYLAREIRAAAARGELDTGERYYHHWLRALERIVQDKRLASAMELERRRQAWDTAARHTEHGQPIVLPSAT